MDLVNVLAYALCLVGLLEPCTGETLAINKTVWDVKLHCKENGRIGSWVKHTKTTPKSWVQINKIYTR